MATLTSKLVELTIFLFCLVGIMGPISVFVMLFYGEKPVHSSLWTNLLLVLYSLWLIAAIMVGKYAKRIVAAVESSGKLLMLFGVPFLIAALMIFPPTLRVVSEGMTSTKEQMIGHKDNYEVITTRGAAIISRRPATEDDIRRLSSREADSNLLFLILPISLVVIALMFFYRGLRLLRTTRDVTS